MIDFQFNQIHRSLRKRDLSRIFGVENSSHGKLFLLSNPNYLNILSYFSLRNNFRLQFQTMKCSHRSWENFLKTRAKTKGMFTKLTAAEQRVLSKWAFQPSTNCTTSIWHKTNNCSQTTSRSKSSARMEKFRNGIFLGIVISMETFKMTIIRLPRWVLVTANSWVNIPTMILKKLYFQHLFLTCFEFLFLEGNVYRCFSPLLRGTCSRLSAQCQQSNTRETAHCVPKIVRRSKKKFQWNFKKFVLRNTFHATNSYRCEEDEKVSGGERRRRFFG